ncbi:hypothetical protein HA402_005203 [Bradysia odoriphaga]|nr:hypothetical protein HA402_005203 [Bradysia odoriphaga]
MGSETSREKPTPESRPNATPTFSSYQPSASYRSPAVPRHQPTVSQNEPSVSHRQPDVLRRESAASQHPSSASHHHQLSASQHRLAVSPRQPEVQHRGPAGSHRNDYALNVNISGDAFVRSALEKCNCETVLQVFVDNEIDKAAFLLLTEDDLKTLLPTKMGPRKKIWEFIQGVRDAAMSDDLQVQDIQSSSSSLQPYVAEPIISESLEHLNHLDLTDEMPQPVTELTRFSPNTRTEYSSSSYDCDDDTIGSTNEPYPPQVVVNRMNQLTLNMQITNHHHNRFLQDLNCGTDSNRFVADEATQDERYGAGTKCKGEGI